MQEGTATDDECDGAFERGWVICGAVRASVYGLEAGEKELTLTWNAAPLGDAVADATACLVLHAALRAYQRCGMPGPAARLLRHKETAVPLLPRWSGTRYLIVSVRRT